MKYTHIIFALTFLLGTALMAQAQSGGPLQAQCDPDDIGPFQIGDRVIYEATVSGGTGSYSYEWRGTEGLSGSSNSTSIRYEKEGSKGGLVIVTSGDEQKTAQCGTIQVYEPPLRGYCEADVYIDEDSAEINWSVRAFGGVRDYEYDWNIPANDDDTRVTQTFEDPMDILGSHSVNIEITSGDPDDDREIDVNCNVTINTLDLLENRKNLSCDAPSDLVTDKELEWRVSVNSGDDVDIIWSGSEGIIVDPEKTNNRSALVTYLTPGLKSATASITSEELTGSITCRGLIADSNDPGLNGESSGDGCFIATAAYGTYMEDEVLLLRNFRDDTLRQSKLGNAFIDAYYTVSPPIADFIRDSEILKAGTRMALSPIVSLVGLIER